MKINYIITENTVTVNFSGKSHTFYAGTKEFEDIILAIKENDMDSIPEIVDLATQIEEYSNEEFKVKDGVIYLDNFAVPSRLSGRILEFKDKELPYEPLVNFARKLSLNPSNRAVNELFGFLETNKHPITEDGNFIAYKGITKNWKDCYTGTIDNSIGTTVSMPRNMVNEDCNQVCSTGLHVANYMYSHNNYGFGNAGITIEVEVDPADVVSVPVDYDGAKMRVSRYTVIGISEGPVEGDIKGYKPDSIEEDDSNDSDENEYEDDEHDEDDDFCNCCSCLDCDTANDDHHFDCGCYDDHSSC